jgi:hypothetical protein
MKYKKGYQVKPLKIVGGHVIFTDGTNEIPASQKTCEAYGYKWNKANSTCVIPTYGSGMIALSRKSNASANTIKGTNNKLQGHVNNSAVYGSSNTFEGNNKNILVNGNNNLVASSVFDSSIISGSNNTITEDVNNSTILSGVGALSIRDSETVVGGFKTTGLADTVGGGNNFSTQYTSFNMQSISTSTDGSVTSLLVSLKTQSDESFIRTHTNSFLKLKIECMVSGDAVGSTSSGNLTAQVSVGSNGVPVITAQSFLHDTAQGSKGNRSFFLTVVSNELVISGQAFSNENSLMSAHVDIMEIIHESGVSIV